MHPAVPFLNKHQPIVGAIFEADISQSLYIPHLTMGKAFYQAVVGGSTIAAKYAVTLFSQLL